MGGLFCFYKSGHAMVPASYWLAWRLLFSNRLFGFSSPRSFGDTSCIRHSEFELLGSSTKYLRMTRTYVGFDVMGSSTGAGVRIVGFYLLSVLSLSLPLASISLYFNFFFSCFALAVGMRKTCFGWYVCRGLRRAAISRHAWEKVDWFILTRMGDGAMMITATFLMSMGHWGTRSKRPGREAFCLSSESFSFLSA